MRHRIGLSDEAKAILALAAFGAAAVAYVVLRIVGWA